MVIDSRERGMEGVEGERERQRETEFDVRDKRQPAASHMCPNRGSNPQPNNLGICPDWESNSQPFGVQDNAPTN